MIATAVRSSVNVKNEKGSRNEQSNIINMYLEPPQEELTLDEFELLSLDRLKLLRGIESAMSSKKNEALDSALLDLDRSFSSQNQRELNRLNKTERDNISHFILRLAYCRTEDLRRWFLLHECILLKYRLEKADDNKRTQFMKENDLEFERVSQDEKMARQDLLAGIGNLQPAAVFSTDFFRVPFTQALSMVKDRAVYLENGMAYVPLSKLVSIIIARYRMHLSKALVDASNMFEYVGGDSRIGPLLKNMNKQHIGNDFSGKSAVMDKLSPDKVDAAADLNMPLCMKRLHIQLKKDHKIKHWGRLQYGLFLKGAGLDMDGANQFWENHFTKMMPHDQFVKQYAYSFRHMYGKEGSRKNYTPYSCMKIIMGSAPEAGGFHGCPYKHMADGELATMLTSAVKLGSNDAKEVVEIAKKKGNYQLACQKHFDIAHPGHSQMTELKNSDGCSNHPNQWFQMSVNYHKLKNGQSLTDSTPTTGAAVAPGFNPGASSEALAVDL